jgi:hypothetical protein
MSVFNLAQKRSFPPLCHCSRATAAACMQFGILPLQVAVWYPATAVGQQPPRACSLVSCQAGSLVVWTMQSCNGRQAVMSALEALVLAGKGLNAFSVLF